jgi:hypothetical protein
MEANEWHVISVGRRLTIIVLDCILQFFNLVCVSTVTHQ